MFNTKFAIISLISIFAINIYPGITYDFYIDYPFFGMTLHFLGGFFMAMLVYSFYKNELEKLPKFLKIISIIGMTMAVGVLWEFTEYSCNKILSGPIYLKYGVRFNFMGDLEDTINDLFMDTLGALAFVLHFFRRANSQKP